MLRRCIDNPSNRMLIKLRGKILIALLVSTLGAQAAPAATLFRTVGFSGCDFTDLQTAIDFMKTQPATDTKILRLVVSALPEVAVEIEDVSLTLAGGFSSCTAATRAAALSVLEGIGSAPVLQISSNGVAQTVRLEGLRLQGGGGQEGGGLRAEGAVTVQIKNSEFLSNSAGRGGAVALLGGAHLELQDVSMLGNAAVSSGGGVYCEDGSVTGSGGNVFRGNFASASGGALALGPECPSTFLGAHTFQDNVAASGGAVSGRAELTFRRGPGDGRPLFIANRADLGSGDHFGGAIAMEDGDVTLEDPVFVGNRVGPAKFSCGGAVAILGPQAQARIESTRRSCHGDPCSVFLDNRGQFGAALCAWNGSIALRGALLTGHSDLDGSPSSSVLSLGELGPVDAVIESSLVVGNSAHNILEKADLEGDLTIAYSTIAANLQVSSLLHYAAAQGNFEGGNPGRIELHSSIFWEDPATAVLVGSGLPVIAECLLLSETQTLALPTHGLTIDPRFLDPAAGDFRLAADSPAIDFCPAGSYPVPGRDVHQGLRGHDDPLTPNAGAGRVHDLGADEFGSDGFLFDDGFEAGGTSAWSLVVG